MTGPNTREEGISGEFSRIFPDEQIQSLDILQNNHSWRKIYLNNAIRHLTTCKYL